MVDAGCMAWAALDREARQGEHSIRSRISQCRQQAGRSRARLHAQALGMEVTVLRLWHWAWSDDKQPEP